MVTRGRGTHCSQAPRSELGAAPGSANAADRPRDLRCSQTHELLLPIRSRPDCRLASSMAEPWADRRWASAMRLCRRRWLLRWPRARRAEWRRWPTTSSHRHERRQSKQQTIRSFVRSFVRSIRSMYSTVQEAVAREPLSAGGSPPRTSDAARSDSSTQPRRHHP